MYKDNSCRSSPQPPPTTQVAEEAEDDPTTVAVTVAVALPVAEQTNTTVQPFNNEHKVEGQQQQHQQQQQQAQQRGRGLEEEEDAFSETSGSNSDSDYEVFANPPSSSTSSSSTASASGSLVCRNHSENKFISKTYNLNSDVRLLRHIGYIASRVRVLAKFYGDFKLNNPYSPRKQKKQLKEIIEKHSIVDPCLKLIEKTEVVKDSSLASSASNSYQQLPTDSSLDEESISTVRKKSLSASIFLLEDLLIQFYEDSCNKLTLIKRRRTRHSSRGSRGSHSLNLNSQNSTNHLIIMSGKTVSGNSVERLLQASSNADSNDLQNNLNMKDSAFLKTQSVATTTFINSNLKQSSQQQSLLHPRSTIFLQPGDDHNRRRRASDCSTHFGMPLPNQLQMNIKNNNGNKFPYHRGSCSGAADSYPTANTMAKRTSGVLSKSCSNVVGSGAILGDVLKTPSYNSDSTRKSSFVSACASVDTDSIDSRGGGGGGGNGGLESGGINSPSANLSSIVASGNNDYSVIQLNNTIIQCHFNDDDFRTLVKELKRKVEYSERMNWLCLSKRPLGPPHRKSSLPKHQEVKKRFLEICDTRFSEEVMAALRLPAFDSYDWGDADVIHLMQTMFIELGFMEKFNIPPETLREWLYEVYKHYNEVPFHNFRHCFCVAQMMYAITRQANLLQRLGHLECLILLVSCICHDLDHPGYNNIYQINARTELALRYNDISPLENHHCSIAFRLLEHPDCNIFKNFSRESFNQIREGIIRCILATDMARHNEILTQFKEITPVFDYNNRAHINLLCMILIKVADISNEARPMDVAEPWLDRLLQEFFAQSAAEKSEGLPVTPFMDPDKVSKPGSQVRFIGLVLLPLFEALGELIPDIIDLIIIPVRVALDYYKRLNDAQTKSRKSVGDSVNSENTSSTSDNALTTTTTTTTASTSVGNNSAPTITTANNESVSPNMHRSHSGMSMKSRRSIPSQKSASRTSVDEPQGLPAELHDLPEGSESGDSETATEVDIAEKTSKFKVDTEGTTSNRSKSSHPSSRKSSREKRPSMIGEMCSSGGGQRMRSSYGNIHGNNANRSHFGSNRALSLDQYSTNNRCLSDGIQQVISDSNFYYGRSNKGPSLLNNPLIGGRQSTDQEVPNIEKLAATSNALQPNIIALTNDGSFQPQSYPGSTFNANLNSTLNANTINANIITNEKLELGTLNTSTTPSKMTWKARLKQFSEYFSISFDKTSKRVGSTRSQVCSIKNNNTSLGEQGNMGAGDLMDAMNGKQGTCCTISSSFQSPGALRKQHPDILKAPRNRAYSLDVPGSRSRFSGSSSGGGDSTRKSSRLDGLGSNTGDENNSINTLNSSSGGCSEIAACMPPPICIGSVDANETMVFVPGVSKAGMPLVNLAETDHTNLNTEFDSRSEPPKI